MTVFAELAEMMSGYAQFPVASDHPAFRKTDCSHLPECRKVAWHNSGHRAVKKIITQWLAPGNYDGGPVDEQGAISSVTEYAVSWPYSVIKSQVVRNQPTSSVSAAVE